MGPNMVALPGTPVVVVTAEEEEAEAEKDYALRPAGSRSPWGCSPPPPAVVSPSPPPYQENDDDPPDGIVIPTFLQPLLGGIDFVPYLPSPERPAPSPPSPSAGTEDGLFGLGLRLGLGLPAPLYPPPPPSSAPDYDVRSDGAADGYDDTETELDEIDRANLRALQRQPGVLFPDLDTPADATATTTNNNNMFTSTRSNGSRRKKDRGNPRILQKAIGKTFQVMKQKRQAKTKDAAAVMNHPSPVIDNVERTPRRRGTRAAGKETLRSSLALSDGGASTCTTNTTTSSSQSSSFFTPSPASERLVQWNRLDQQVQTLRSLEDKAYQVQQRAAAQQGRITALTTQATQLQQALAQVLQSIDQETAQLHTTQEHLQLLEDTFQSTAQQLAVSLDRIQHNFGQWDTTPSPQTEIRPVPLSSSTSFSLGRQQRSYTETDGQSRRHPLPPPPDHPGTTHRQTRIASFDDMAVLRNHIAATASSSSTTTTPAHVSSTGPRRRANTDPRPGGGGALVTSTASSFMRVGDLEMQSASSTATSSASLQSLDDAILQSRLLNTGGANGATAAPGGADDFFLLEENVPYILSRLFDLGIQMATDESSRFTPVSDTPRILQNKKCFTPDPLPGWPYCPWHVAKDKDILVWTGGVPHKNFGHDWPVVKARCVVRTSPRKLLDFLMDSSQLKKYNKMSQGRETVFVLQDGVDTRVENSSHGFAGDARIMRALNKPKLLPKTIEMLSLWHTKAIPDATGAYMTVSRSVWENATGTPKNSNRLRSEMLLGAQLLRPLADGSHCELTTITHVFAPGVPEIMAKRMAPQSAANMMREIQSVFA